MATWNFSVLDKRHSFNFGLVRNTDNAMKQTL